MKAKAAVVLGVAEDNAAERAMLTKNAQSFAHEQGADATTLMLRRYGYGAKAEPAGPAVRCGYRRHSDVTHYAAFNIRNQRYCQAASLT